MGTTGLWDLQCSSSLHWNCTPSKFRTPRTRRLWKRRLPLSRYLGGNRFTHHHDQWIGYCWLGRRWHRSGIGDARSASLFENAWSDWSEPWRQLAQGRNRNRFNTSHHWITSSWKSCRQVCRISRRRREEPKSRRPSHHFQYGSRIRGDHGIFSHRWKIHRVLRTNRPKSWENCSSRSVSPRTRTLWNSQKRKHCLH